MTTVEERRLPRYCPTWCLNDHQDGVNEGNAPEDCTEHRSPDFGGILHTLSNPFTGEILRAGGAGWWAQLYQPVGQDGWDSRSQITLELRESHEHDRKNAVVTFEPSELLELARDGSPI